MLHLFAIAVQQWQHCEPGCIASKLVTPGVLDD
jgi:hypothetical protein